jgi:hypothetical protein
MMWASPTRHGGEATMMVALRPCHPRIARMIIIIIIIVIIVIIIVIIIIRLVKYPKSELGFANGNRAWLGNPL